MLKGLLEKSDCAGCRLCCSFDSYDLWETPVISGELEEKITALLPYQRFSYDSGTKQMVMQREPDKDVYYCPLLNHDSGCILGDDKPFECRIWPFKVMTIEGRRCIALSPVCPVVSEKSFREIRKTAYSLAKQIFEEADRQPDTVRPYIKGYPIILTEK